MEPHNIKAISIYIVTREANVYHQLNKENLIPMFGDDLYKRLLIVKFKRQMLITAEEEERNLSYQKELSIQQNMLLMLIFYYSEALVNAIKSYFHLKLTWTSLKVLRDVQKQ